MGRALGYYETENGWWDWFKMLLVMIRPRRSTGEDVFLVVGLELGGRHLLSSSRGGWWLGRFLMEGTAFYGWNSLWCTYVVTSELFCTKWIAILWPLVYYIIQKCDMIELTVGLLFYVRKWILSSVDYVNVRMPAVFLLFFWKGKWNDGWLLCEKKLSWYAASSSQRVAPPGKQTGGVRTYLLLRTVLSKWFPHHVGVFGIMKIQLWPLTAFIFLPQQPTSQSWAFEWKPASNPSKVPVSSWQVWKWMREDLIHLGYNQLWNWWDTRYDYLHCLFVTTSTL